MSAASQSRLAWAARSLFALFLLALAPARSQADGPLLTRWASAVSATNPLPDYPRPQLVRDRWQSLNGPWDYAITQSEQQPKAFTNRILVPFPIESSLSGVGRHLEESEVLWYRRAFKLPAAWRNQRIQLHFGAVDWAAKVFLNGRYLGAHRGGYDAFSFDLTPALHWETDNELLVAVTDPTEGDQPRGKQSRKPEGIFYTPSSGIWQTVWLEPVPPLSIGALNLVPDFAAAALRLQARVNASDPDLEIEAAITFAGQPAGSAAGPPGKELRVTLPQPVHPWHPSTPALYDVQVRLRRGDQVLDCVRSYFGLREVRVAADAAGHRRLFLNGEPLLQIGVLDQGFWPDGLYTAPTDEALRFDLETAKRLGFNLVRKHVKVEPERWYGWADRLGILVWQDMPSGNNPGEAARHQFEQELQRLVEQKANHPCLITWVLFNEGWGQFDTERLARRLKLADPTRLVDNASGWTDLKAGDVIDLHSYPDPVAPAAEVARAGVLGEFGGLDLGVEGHTWSSRQAWGYQRMADSAQLLDRYTLLLDKIWDLHADKGLAAAIYTQLTDVETECNGFLTYDRAVLKADSALIRRANLHLPNPPASSVLLPNALQGQYDWTYTTNPPPADWFQTSFPAADWRTGPGGFGTSNTPKTLVHTEWNTGDIWLRRQFDLPAGCPAPLALLMSHDEDAEVYLNGTPAVQAKGYSVGYQEFFLPAEAVATLHPGRNWIAVHCHQTGGGQYIDVGLLGQEHGADTPNP